MSKVKAICPEFITCKIASTCMHSRVHRYYDSWCLDNMWSDPVKNPSFPYPTEMRAKRGWRTCPGCTQIK